MSSKKKQAKMQKPQSEVKVEETAPGKTDDSNVGKDVPPVSEDAAKASPSDKEADIGDIGKNAKSKARGPSGPRTGDAMGAKPKVRALMGTVMENGEYPSFTVEELCTATKKSDVNIRTILSDLRSPKYCGAGGVFLTNSYKKDGKTYYIFGVAPQEPAKPADAPAA